MHTTICKHKAAPPGQLHRFHQDSYGASDDEDDYAESDESSNSDKGSVFEFTASVSSKSKTL